MPTVNEEVLDRAIRHAVYLDRFGSKQVAEHLDFLDTQVFPDLMGQVQNRLQTIQNLGFDRGPEVTRRLNELTAATDKTIRTGFSVLEKRGLKAFSGLGLSEAEWMRSVMKGSIPGIDVDFITPNPTLLNSIVASKPMHGRYVREWYGSLSDDAQRLVRDQIRIGMAEGEPVAQIARRLRGVKSTGYTDGALHKTRRHTEAVVRNSTQHVSAHAREATYQANADLIEQVRYVATLDRRTTLICIGLDGKLFPINEGPRPPQHFNCRSTTVPVLGSWQALGKKLGIPLKDIPPSTRASMNGQVPSTMTYGQWLKKQPVEIQNDVLGVRRAQLWRQGKVKIDKFTDPQNRVLTLAQLEKKEGIRSAARPKKPTPTPVPLKDKYPPLNPDGVDTEAMFRTAEEVKHAATEDPWRAHKGWTPERKQLHNSIVDDLLSEGAPQPEGERVFHFMGGGPAAGKSTVLDQGYVRLPKSAVKIDPDDIKKRLPEYRRMLKEGDPSAASFVHNESSVVQLRAIRESLDRDFNVMLDGTGDGSYEKLRNRINWARKNGYKVKATYVDIPTDEALARAAKRAKQTGRAVPEEYIKQTYQNLSETLPRMLDEGLWFDDFELWDNATPSGIPKLVVSKKKGSQLIVHDNWRWERFKARNPNYKPKAFPPKNPTGASTWDMFRDEATGVWTPERSVLHKEIVDRYLNGYRWDTKRKRWYWAGDPVSSETPHIHMLGGGSGSGKSTLVRKGITKPPEGAIWIDPDEIKDLLPEFGDMLADPQARARAAAFVHDESSLLQLRILERARQKKLNVLLDGTGDGSYAKLKGRVDRMRKQGYKVTASYVDIPTEEALRRVAGRAAETGRHVPESVVISTYDGVSKVVPKAVAENLFDEVTLWNNAGDTPMEIMRYSRKKRLTGKTAGKVIVQKKLVNEELWTQFLRGGDDPVPWRTRKKKLAVAPTAKQVGWRERYGAWNETKFREEQRRWQSGLTSGERESIRHWTGGGYGKIRAVQKWDGYQDFLRATEGMDDKALFEYSRREYNAGRLPKTHKRRRYRGWEDVRVDEFDYTHAGRVQRALERAPRDRKATLYRGLQNYQPITAVVGDELVIPATSSFSTNANKARAFMGGDHPLMYKFTAGKGAGGVNVVKLSHYSTEAERMVLGGRRFKILKIERFSRYTQFTLEEIGDGIGLTGNSAGAGVKVKPPKPKPFKPRNKNISEIDGTKLKRVGAQKGSNPGGVFEDPKTKKKYYVKTPQSDAHVYNEILASKLYEAAGVDVPKLHLTEINGKLSVASEWNPNVASAVTKLTTGELPKSVWDGFAVDAWLGNWDVVGTGMDNLLYDKVKKRFVRIDAGGSLLYRAKGAAKGSKFTDEVLELDRMRNPSKSKNAARVFGRMDDYEVWESINRVVYMTEEEIDKIIDETLIGSPLDGERAYLKKKLKARRNHLVDINHAIEEALDLADD